MLSRIFRSLTIFSKKRDLKISLSEAPQSCFPLNSCRKITEVNVHQRKENHGMLLLYRPSNFKEKGLKLPVICLTSKQTFLGRRHVSLPHQPQLKRAVTNVP